MFKCNVKCGFDKRELALVKKAFAILNMASTRELAMLNVALTREN